MIKTENEPCSEGGTHTIEVRKLKPFLSEAYCTKCDLGWGDLYNLIMARYVPPADIAVNSLWKGTTYEWEFDGTEWSVYSPAPGGVDLFGDLPLRPMVTTYGAPYDKNEGAHSRACGWKAHSHGSACDKNCPTCHGDKL